MNRTAAIIIFAAGAAIGSLVTMRCVKKKYGKIAQDEIDSVKETFSKRQGTADLRAKRKAEFAEYGDTLQRNGYADCPDGPYVIPPEEFGEIRHYGKISLTCYADGILADDGGELVDDVEGTVGADSLMKFGEYEDDSVFVRNDRLKCDYEILLDQRKYSDAAGQCRTEG
jgi:hypothetical protein